MPEIQHVSDTAFMIAAYRAAETARSDALFRDPLAVRLAGERGRAIVADMGRSSRFISWNVAIRTRIIDDFILQAVANGVDTVLNLGAGLDTRPYRLSLPTSLKWIEVDYPHMIAFKTEQLAGERPVCQLERIALDLADGDARRAMLSDVNARSRAVFVLTEGVVPYLTNDDAGALMDDLAAQPTFRYWVTDYFAPVVHEYRERGKMRQKMAQAPFKFRPGDYYGFIAEHGWAPREVRYLPIESMRLGRAGPWPRLMRWWLAFASRFAPQEKRDAWQKFAGYVLFEPARGATTTS